MKQGNLSSRGHGVFKLCGGASRTPLPTDLPSYCVTMETSAGCSSSNSLLAMTYQCEVPKVLPIGGSGEKNLTSSSQAGFSFLGYCCCFFQVAQPLSLNSACLFLSSLLDGSVLPLVSTFVSQPWRSTVFLYHYYHLPFWTFI